MSVQHEIMQCNIHLGNAVTALSLSHVISFWVVSPQAIEWLCKWGKQKQQS